NDVILAFNGEAIENDDHLSSMVGLTEVDSVIELLLIRKRKPLTVKVTLKHREDFEKGS
ncbi:MAG TPA: serine protease, partial [Planctomycetaceae bacterium]|nr:serine protease [Planctomycetaceae bacterium]HCK72139.1 serine protease [Planctomycetaceae bacterium]